MADTTQIKETVALALGYIENVFSFASSFSPIFDVVTSVIRVARKGLTAEEGHALDKEFQRISTKLENISQKNRECLRQIHIQEVNETYGKHEECIKHQYGAFNNMVAQVMKDPDNSKNYIETFQKIYKKDEAEASLDVYYRGVMDTGTVFGRPLLKVYLENCNSDLEIMEHHCSKVAHLFHMGLIPLMAYTSVTGDDEDGEREKWGKKMKDIQTKMQEVLSQCKGKDAP